MNTVWRDLQPIYMTGTTISPISARRYDLIAFDWDGTLFDSTASIAESLQAAVRDVGGIQPSMELALHVIGLGLEQALTMLAPDVPRSRYMQLVQSYRMHYMQAQHKMQLFDGALALLQTLKACHYWLAVATAKSRKGLRECLQNPDLQGIFDASKTSEETAGKPDPLMLKTLMAEFGAEPDRCLMIGDTTHDLQMAQNAGCPCVAVAWGAHPRTALEALKPLYVAESMPDLQTWLYQNA